MDEQKMFEAMAKWQGLIPAGSYESYKDVDPEVTEGLYVNQAGQLIGSPNYLSDSVLDEIVRGLDEYIFQRYTRCLRTICGETLNAYRPTQAQKLEALLRCLALWEEEW